MLTRILHHSERLCTFLDQLDIQLSRPQHRHILNVADALLVCEDTKTLAALQRQPVARQRCASSPAEMAVETGDTDLVLQRFLRLEAQPA